MTTWREARDTTTLVAPEQARDVSPEGRVLAGVMTGRAMVWLNPGLVPVAAEEDPRLVALLADRRAREALGRQGRGACAPPRRR